MIEFSHADLCFYENNKKIEFTYTEAKVFNVIIRKELTTLDELIEKVWKGRMVIRNNTTSAISRMNEKLVDHIVRRKCVNGYAVFNRKTNKIVVLND